MAKKLYINHSCVFPYFLNAHKVLPAKTCCSFTVNNLLFFLIFPTGNQGLPGDVNRDLVRVVVELS